MFQIFLMKIFGIFIFLPLAGAHPVSFEGSKGIMGYHSPRLHHVQLNYSMTHRFAFGVHHFDLPSDDGDRFANFLSTNFLLKRWNGAGHQANIYLVTGLGHSQFLENSVPTGFGKVQFDIEDRDYYFLGSYAQFFSEDRQDMKEFLVRSGISPYVGAYDDIHTWLILEWRSMNLVDQGFRDEVTPFIRIFYKNILFEVGQSFNGLTRFNYIVHF